MFSPRLSLLFMSVSFKEDAFPTIISTTEFSVFRPTVTQTPTLPCGTAVPVHTKLNTLTITRPVPFPSRYIFRSVTLTITRKRQNTSTKWEMLHRRPTVYSRSIKTYQQISCKHEATCVAFFFTVCLYFVSVWWWSKSYWPKNVAGWNKKWTREGESVVFGVDWYC